MSSRFQVVSMMTREWKLSEPSKITVPRKVENPEKVDRRQAQINRTKAHTHAFYGCSFAFAGAARTTARLDGEEWMLDGTKAWITNAHDAQSSIVFATTDSSKKHK